MIAAPFKVLLDSKKLTALGPVEDGGRQSCHSLRGGAVMTACTTITPNCMTNRGGDQTRVARFVDLAPAEPGIGPSIGPLRPDSRRAIRYRGHTPAMEAI